MIFIGLLEGICFMNLIPLEGISALFFERDNINEFTSSD